MKRSNECLEEIARLDKKRTKLEDELEKLNKQLRRESLEKAQAEQQRFVRDLLGLGKPLAPLLPNADPNYVPATIGDCLVKQDLALMILAHLGPIELYYTTRVCTAFASISTCAFKVFAELQLARYGEDLVRMSDSVQAECLVRGNAQDVETGELREYRAKHKSFVFDASRLGRLMQDQRREKPLKTLTIGEMLSLWYHAFVEYRRYLLRDHDYVTGLTHYGKIEHEKAYSFFYDKKSRKCVSLRDAPIFRINKYSDAEAKFDSHWKKRGYNFTLAKEEKMSHLRKKELKYAKFVPVKQRFRPTKDFVRVDPATMQFSPLRTDKTEVCMLYVEYREPYRGISKETVPFFDMCELNHLFMRRDKSSYHSARIPYTKLSLSQHIAACGYVSLSKETLAK